MLLLSVVDYCGVPCGVIGAVCQVARMLNDHVCTWTPYFWGLSSCFLKYNFIACASCVFCSVVMWFCAHVLVVRTKRRTMVGFAIWPWASGFIIDSALLVQLHTSQAIKVASKRDAPGQRAQSIRGRYETNVLWLLFALSTESSCCPITFMCCSCYAVCPWLSTTWNQYNVSGFL